MTPKELRKMAEQLETDAIEELRALDEEYGVENDELARTLNDLETRLGNGAEVLKMMAEMKEE